MKKTAKLLVILLYICSCTPTESESDLNAAKPQRVLLKTNLGEITLQLSDRTPLHRDNFIKLVKEGAFDSLLFHRVIEGFVIQGGDPDSKTAKAGDTLGGGGLDYKVPAEFDSTLFHKRGALGAARDGNPERASSAMQFYVVQASKPLSDSLMEVNEIRINGWLRDHYSLNAPENKMWLDSLNKATEVEDWNTAGKVRDTLAALAESFTGFARYSIPKAHKAIYQSLGGTPHLDQNYTIFGEVVSGMEVVDSIAAQEVDELNRPVEDIRILSASIIE